MTPPTPSLLSSIPLQTHEQAMREAIKIAAHNPAYPFGAIITDSLTGELRATGVNASRTHPILHGEIVCMNNYVQNHGNGDWSRLILYTTGEPCAMCMSALTWAGIGGVVFGSSIDSISRAGIRQIKLSAQSVIDAADFTKPALRGAVLEHDCDALFMQRRRT